MNRIDLKGRVAIITGGARGIGFAVAERFVASGAKVALWDVDGTQAERAAQRLEGAFPQQVDVTDDAAIAASVASTEHHLGPPDILVASAGLTGPNLPVAQYPVAAWLHVIDIDLTGVFLCCRAVVAGMAAPDYVRII